MEGSPEEINIRQKFHYQTFPAPSRQQRGFSQIRCSGSGQCDDRRSQQFLPLRHCSVGAAVVIVPPSAAYRTLCGGPDRPSGKPGAALPSAYLKDALLHPDDFHYLRQPFPATDNFYIQKMNICSLQRNIVRREKKIKKKRAKSCKKIRKCRKSAE